MIFFKRWNFILLGNLIWVAMPIGYGLFDIRFVSTQIGPANAGARGGFIDLLYLWLCLLVPLNILFLWLSRKLPMKSKLFYWNEQKRLTSWIFTILSVAFIFGYFTIVFEAIKAEFLVPGFYIEIYGPFMAAVWFSLVLRTLLLAPNNAPRT